MVVLSRLESDDVFQPARDEVCVFSLAGLGGLAVIGDDNRVYDVVQTKGKSPRRGSVGQYVYRNQILEIHLSTNYFRHVIEKN